MNEVFYSVYILRCSDNTYYTGISKDVNARIEAHNKARGAKYTRARRPVVLCYLEEGYTQKNALQREREIKRFTRKKKEALIEK